MSSNHQDAPTRGDGYYIPVHVASQYRVFDKSGGLPSAIVFSLYRRHRGDRVDKDPRSITLDVSGSVFDVPFALKSGIFKIYQQPGEKEIDMSDLDVGLCGSRFITIPSIVGKSQHSMTIDYHIYECPLDPNGSLASILQPGVEYKLKFAGRDLGVRWWAFGDLQEVVKDGKPCVPSEPQRLITTIHPGSPQSTVREKLNMPPSIHILLKPSVSTSKGTDDPTPKLTIETHITNSAEKPLIFQTRGWQGFKAPRGPFLNSFEDTWTTRIGDVHVERGKESLIIIDKMTGEEMWPNLPISRWTRGYLVQGETHSKPSRDNVVQLRGKRAEPVSSMYDLTDVMGGLSDGTYDIKLRALGAWWSWVDVYEVFGSDETIQKGLQVVPLKLASDDVITVRKSNGEIVIVES